MFQCLFSLISFFKETGTKVKYELLSFQYIGLDGEYAFARTEYSSKKISGEDFQDNTIDMIHAFRKDKGHWRFWSSMILEIRYDNEQTE